MRLDQRRFARFLVLTTWAVFFTYLQVTKESLRYIGPRTSWVVPFGAIVLTLAALAHLPVLRRREKQPLRLGEMAGLIVTILPILIVVMAPAPELGSLAASRKGGTTGLATALSFAPPSGDREASFIDVHYANLSEDYAAQTGIADGRPMDLTGFVTHDGEVETFRLTRFYISCCAADAIPYSVTIIPPEDEDFDDDTWLHVEGLLRKTDDGYVLEAEDIEETVAPETPYLS